MFSGYWKINLADVPFSLIRLQPRAEDAGESNVDRVRAKTSHRADGVLRVVSIRRQTHAERWNPKVLDMAIVFPTYRRFFRSCGSNDRKTMDVLRMVYVLKLESERCEATDECRSCAQLFFGKELHSDKCRVLIMQNDVGQTRLSRKS